MDYHPENLRVHKRRRDLLVGVGVGLVITIVVTSYMIRGRSEPTSLPIVRSGPTSPVVLTVRPPHALVLLDGQPVGPLDESGRMKLDLPTDATSIRWLEISANGYHTLRRPVSIYGGVGEATIELIQKPYEVMVRTEPPHAEVWMNDELKGLSPLAVAVTPGEKTQLALKLSGYETVTREIAPPDDRDKVDMDVTLQPAGRLVRIETDPPGAQILVNGRPRAIAPCSLPIDPQLAGTTLQLTASLAGHEDAVSTLTIPDKPEATIQPLVLRLAPIGPQLRIATHPPGGQIVIDGKDYGPAPVVARFAAGRAGASIVVEGSLGATHRGRQSFVIPEPGRTSDVTLPLAFAAQRVVFILSPSRKTAGADHYALVNALSQQIHRLAADQCFVLLINTQQGLLIWPEGADAPPATHHEKIRSYDRLRALRPADGGDWSVALDAAMKLNPSTLWLFSAQSLPQEFAERAAPLLSERNVRVHVVTLARGPQDESLAAWLSRRHGTLTLLGQDAMPAVALENHDEP